MPIVPRMSDPLRPLTIAIPSHQRRAHVTALVRALADQAREDPTGWAGVDIVVALDGSDDGSKEALEALEPGIPLAVIWRPHGGASAARNACVEAATGEVIYFLDDDLVPAPGTVLRHRRAQEEGPARAVLGPCLIPESIRADPGIRAWWDERYAELARTGRVTRFDQFSIANASLPRQAVLDVGGFSTAFQGYGFEDYELGLRLMRAGVMEDFDADAVVWHHTDNNEKLAVVREREIGRNTVRLLRLHPEIADEHFPATYPGPAAWLLDMLPVRSARGLAAISRAAGAAADRLGSRGGRAGAELRRLESRASYGAGIADLDATWLPRAMGRPASGRTRTWRTG